MRFEISKDKRHENAFAVCLLKVPEFPIKTDKINPVVRVPLLAVVGAVFDKNLKSWSFTNLSMDEKHLIGDALCKVGAEIDEWMWCIQHED